MNLLLEHFHLLTGQPEHIAKLKGLILQLAVQGKLVPQDPNDEPASRLLERIVAEKERLVREKKIKKETPLPAIAEEETPYELPEGWSWCRLGEIAIKLGAGSTPLGGKEVYQAEGIKFLRSQNVYDDGLRLNEVAYITQETHRRMSGTHVFPKDILLNITGASIGRSSLVPDDFDTANVSQHVAIVRLADTALRSYIHKLIISPQFQQTIMNVQVGVSREGLSMTKLKDFLVPLPPLSEQERIVGRVDELFRQLEALSKVATQVREGRKQVGQAMLHQLGSAASPGDLERSWSRIAGHFGDVFSDGSNVKALRQTILQLAVQGKLVPQDPADEPAAVLLERIKAEKEQLVREKKIKKEAPLPPVSTEEMPYELPEGWAWCRLCSLGFITGGGTPSMGRSDFWNGDIPWISPKDMKAEFVSDSEMKVTALGVENSSANLIPEGSLLIVGRSGILKRTLPVAINTTVCTVNQDLKVIIPHLKQLNRYIQLMLKGHESYILKKLVKLGTTVHSLKYDEFALQPFPLPPFNEQQLIIKKVESLLGLCDQLEATIGQSEEQAGKLLQAVLRETVTAEKEVEDVL